MQRRVDREIAELVGLLKGIIADGVVNEEEVAGFRQWLSDHPSALERWPAKHLSSRLTDMLSDGIIDPDERTELHALFRATAIDGFDPARFGPWSALWDPATMQTRIRLDERPLAFTGAFAYGTRRDCAAAVVDRGGVVYDSVIDVPMTLVVGRSAPSVPGHARFEDELRRALEYRSNGTPITLMGEEHWVDALTA